MDRPSDDRHKCYESDRTPTLSNQAVGHAVEPNDETLLLYLIEPDQLTPDQHTALLSWLTAAPENADRLAALAAQVCDLVDQVNHFQPTATQIVATAKPSMPFHWPLWVATAASVLIALWWFNRLGPSPALMSDEVALAWATHHDPQAISGSELWSPELWTEYELEFLPELSNTGRSDANSDIAFEDVEQAIGFSDSEPPEWLVAAFADVDMGDDFNPKAAE